MLPAWLHEEGRLCHSSGQMAWPQNPLCQPWQSPKGSSRPQGWPCSASEEAQSCRRFQKLTWIFVGSTGFAERAVLTPRVRGFPLIFQPKDAGTHRTLCYNLKHTPLHPCPAWAAFWLQCLFWHVILPELGFGIRGFYPALTLVILLYT